MKHAFIAAAVGAGLALASGTAANATIVLGTGVIPNVDNVLFTNNPPPGTTVQGVLNSTPYNVTFMGNETLNAPSNGQARIGAQTGGLDFISYTLGTGLGFDSTVFDVNTNQANPGGTLTITAFDQFGTASVFGGNSLAGNGQHFFNLTTLDNQLITSVQLSTTSNFLDLRQTRIGGVEAISGGVPEPSTWAMMLIGFAGLAYTVGRKQTSGGAALSAT